MQQWETRQRLVRAAIDFMQGTEFAPQAPERYLLNLFIDGTLTLSQVLVELAALEQDAAAGELLTQRVSIH